MLVINAVILPLGCELQHHVCTADCRASQQPGCLGCLNDSGPADNFRCGRGSHAAIPEHLWRDVTSDERQPAVPVTILLRASRYEQRFHVRRVHVGSIRRHSGVLLGT